MCEKCDEREKQKQILGCQKCISNACSLETKQPEIVDVNHAVEDPIAESKKIDEEMKKQHKELINGYDKQLGDCLRDLAKFLAKMLIMYDDYLKKGNVDEMIKLLQSIENYGLLSQSNAAVIVTTINMLVGKIDRH